MHTAKTLLSTLLLFFCSSALFGYAFENKYNHTSGAEIRRVKVCGERCSGTNFLDYLLHKNFPNVAPTSLLEFGQKHFLCWFHRPFDPLQLQRLQYKSDAATLAGSGDCLFVVVVRDPYDWIRSFYLSPHCVHEELLKRGFSHFIRSEWRVKDRYHALDGQYDEIDNYNPWTDKPFIHVFELRKYKIENYLALGALVDNYLFVRYEDVRDHPEEFVDFVAKHYQMAKNREFTPITTLKGSHVPYVEKKYFSLRPRDLEFINKSIDWTTEEKIGYLPCSRMP